MVNKGVDNCFFAQSGCIARVLYPYYMITFDLWSARVRSAVRVRWGRGDQSHTNRTPIAHQSHCERWVVVEDIVQKDKNREPDYGCQPNLRSHASKNGSYSRTPSGEWHTTSSAARDLRAVETELAAFSL